MENKVLQFSGGGGGDSQNNPPDNLRSDDSAEVLIGLCEGPILGLENGENSVYFDDTKLVSDSGEKNFTDYTLDLKKGDASQDETIYFQMGGSSLPNNVGQELFQNASVTRSTTIKNLDYVDIRFQISQLYYADDDGIFYTSAHIRIEYKRDVDTIWTRWNGDYVRIEGKTTSAYTKDYRIPLPKYDGLYDIRITKLSADSPLGDTGFFNKIVWSQFEEIVAKNKEFKNTALLHVNIKTGDQVTNLPQISGIYKLRTIRVPSNYDAENKTYTGEWDGTFKIEWSDNPAWCLYDFLTHDRYGVAHYYPIVVDKWDFYEAGKYCDEKVSDGHGGLEARYTFNGIITEGLSGREMIDYIAGTFNGILYEDAMGIIHLTTQADNQASHIFSPENITSVGFEYSIKDPSERYNDISIKFINPELDWQSDTRKVSDEEDIELNGRVTLEFEAIGCTKESEAIRRGRYQLISALSENLMVSFSTNRLAYNIDVFDTILIADPDMGYSVSGRIKSVEGDGLVLKLRDPIFLEAGVDYVLKLQSPSGIYDIALEIREVGYVDTLYLSNYIPSDLEEKAVFSLIGKNTNLGEPKPFRVISISESNGNPDEVSITALEINRNKQIEADNDIELTEVEFNTLPSISNIPHVDSVSITSNYVPKYKSTYTIVEMKVNAEKYPYYSGEFEFYSREFEGENDAWQKRVVQFGDTVVNHPSGEYEVKILPKNTLGQVANFDTAPIFRVEIFDMKKPPADVSNFRVEESMTHFTLKWDAVKDVDLMCYEIREGNDWKTAKLVASEITGQQYTVYIPDPFVHSYLIKAKDSSGVYSVNPTYVEASVKTPSDITEFYVTPNEDRIRFDWVCESDSDVEFEVRMGDTWESGITLFKTKGNNQTVLAPKEGTGTFYIKSVSSLGKYSENSRYSTIPIALAQNRNVILEIDNAEEGFTGITNGLETTKYEGILSMKDGVYKAEHYFPVRLNEVTRARNWFETEAFRFGEKLKWKDLNFTWDSEEAKNQTWISSEELREEEGKITPVISTEKTSEYQGFLGYRYDDTSSDVNNENPPVYQKNVNYGAGRYTNGLVLNRIVGLRYEIIDLPELFTLRFKLKMTQSSISEFSILTLYNSTTGASLSLYYKDKKIICEGSDGSVLKVNADRIESTDYLSVMITQKENERIVDFYSEYANIRNRGTIDEGSLGVFDRLYIGDMRNE